MKSPGSGQLLRSALDHLGCLGQWMFKSLAWVCCSASCVAFVISNVPKHLKRRFALPRHSSKDFMLYAETGVRLTQTLCFVTWLANGLQGCVESAGDGGVRASRGRWRQQYPRAHLKIERARRQTACPGSLHGGFGLCCNGPACVEEVALLFEDFCPPGWAYTAMTRARSMQGLLVSGHRRSISSHSDYFLGLQ